MKRGRCLRIASDSGRSSSSRVSRRSDRTSIDRPVSAMILSMPPSTRPSASPSAPNRSRPPLPVSAAVTSSTVTARDRAWVVRSTMEVWRARSASMVRSIVECVSSEVASRTMPMTRTPLPFSSRTMRPWVCVQRAVPSRRNTWKYMPYDAARSCRARRNTVSSRSPSSGDTRLARDSGRPLNSSGSRSKTLRAAPSSSRVPSRRSQSKLPMWFRARRSAGPVRGVPAEGVPAPEGLPRSGGRSCSGISLPPRCRGSRRSTRQHVVSEPSDPDVRVRYRDRLASIAFVVFARIQTTTGRARHQRPNPTAPDRTAAAGSRRLGAEPVPTDAVPAPEGTST
ncbi:hypothetical protein M2266_003751 [Streptomyces sp. SPB162]|nr:hypothetical protein [Streptomyces sp. SPB162]